MCASAGAEKSRVPQGRPHLPNTYAFLIRASLFFHYALHGRSEERLGNPHLRSRADAAALGQRGPAPGAPQEYRFLSVADSGLPEAASG